MKKIVRILIPLFLVLTILLCTFWYLFVYDRDFTRDVLLTFARSSEMRGKHTFASWLYDLAYMQSGDDESVAIELAEQYKKAGNYTKAENTLSNAITDGGGVDLYVALCQTYIEQDKLLDAVKMLNSIANEDVKKQIEQMRPAAPTPTQDQAPGIYKQYIAVKLESNGGKIYTSMTADYPSTQNPAYDQPLQMADGENTIYAVAIKDGLISPLAIYTYTINDVVETVTIDDPAMDIAVRESLNVSEDSSLMTSDLWKIETFIVPKDAKNYDALQYMINLVSLTIEDGNSQQLFQISAAKNLKELTIKNTAVSSDVLTAIGSISTLESLTMHGCGLTSIRPLENSTKITDLDISNNTIRSVEPVAQMANLKVFNCKQNVIVDLSPLSANKNLTQLDISYNAVTTLAPLSVLGNLTLLEANNNGITDLGDMNQLTALSYLSLGYNSVSDISKLSACTELTNLNLSSNKISDISVVGSLTKLMYFDFSYNEVTQLPTWSKDSVLVAINGSHNKLSSLDSLSGMACLNNVNMDYNKEITSVDELATCPVLIRVDVYGTKVTNVESLTKQSIIVIYNEVDGKTE